MSAPDSASPGAGYFADYEVYAMGEAIAWGQITLACSSEDDREPAALIRRLRQAAADQHGAEAGTIRLRQVCRL